MSIQSSAVIIIIIIIIISVMLHHCCSQLQQQVEFFPINNRNCSSENEMKICAVDATSDMLSTSSLTECSIHCWVKLPDCLQFNYHSSPTPVTSSNCVYSRTTYVIRTSDMLTTSSLTECSMHCWMKLPDCLQFNYQSTPTPVTSSNCVLKNYVRHQDVRYADDIQPD